MYQRGAIAWMTLALLAGCANGTVARSVDAVMVTERALGVDPSAPRSFSLTTTCTRAFLEVRAVWVAPCEADPADRPPLGPPPHPVETATIWLGELIVDSVVDDSEVDPREQTSAWTVNPDLVGPPALDPSPDRPTLATESEPEAPVSTLLCEAGPASGVELTWESESGPTGTLTLNSAGRAIVAAPPNSPTLLRTADGGVWWTPACVAD